MEAPEYYLWNDWVGFRKFKNKKTLSNLCIPVDLGLRLNGRRVYSSKLLFYVKKRLGVSGLPASKIRDFKNGLG